MAVIILLVDRFTGQRADHDRGISDLNSIAVFPFEVRGKSELQYLREGMVDLISTKLDGITGMNSIDPFVILAKVRNSEMTVQDPDHCSKISMELGAHEFLLGSIVDLGDKLRFSASKYSGKGQLISQTEVETEDTKHLSKTIDELVFELISDKFKSEGQEFNSLAALMTEDLDALKHYIEGESHYRKNEFREAIHKYDQALKIDSTFAQAWFKLDRALGWDVSLKSEFSPAVIRSGYQNHSGNLPPKWKDYFGAFDMFLSRFYGAEDEFKRLIKEYGESYDLLNGLAETIFHNGPFYGRPIQAAEPYLSKAVEYDPGNQEAYIHLADIAFIRRDTVQLIEIQKRQSRGSLLWYKIENMMDLLKKDVTAEEVMEIMNRPGNEPGINLWNVMRLDRDWILMDTIKVAVQMMDESFNKNQLRNYFEFSQGREKEIAESTLALLGGLERQIFLANGAQDLSSYIADPDLMPFSEYYSQVKESLDSFDPMWYRQWAGDDRIAIIFKNLYQGKICLAIKDEGCFETNLLEIKQFELEDDVGKLANFCRLSLLATQKVLNGEFEDAKMYVDSSWRIDIDNNFINLMKTNAAASNIVILARYHENKGEYEQAIELYRERNFVGLNYFPGIFYGFSQYKQAQLYELKGDRDKALEIYDNFIHYYQDCDDKYKPWLEDAQARRDALFQASM